MNDLQIFDVEGGNWRFGQDPDGTPWAVATDVAKGFEYRDARDATRQLDGDEKGTRIVRTPGGPQSMTVIFEDGLWELVFLSRKPEAKAIKKRVKAILREIRETGSYSVDVPRTLPDALRAYATEVEAHEATKERVRELEPAADAWNVLAEAKGDYSLREAAQILNRDPLISTGQNRLAAYLRTIGWVDRSKQPYQREVDNGRLVRRPTHYTKPSGDQQASSQIRITPKGLKELRRRMTGQPPLFGIEGGAA